MNLERAIEIARETHAGQVDKGGAPYIEHCLRVMNAMETEDEKIVAILHDVVEDSDKWSLESLENMGLKEDLVDSLVCLTRPEWLTYDEYIEWISLDDIACRVKIADLKDNMDLTRIPNPTEKDFKRVEKYKIALAFLERWQ